MKLRKYGIVVGLLLALACGGGGTKPPGPPAPPTPPPPPPVQTQGELHGVAIDQNGKALEGARIRYFHNGVLQPEPQPVWAISKDTSDNWCKIKNLPPNCPKAPPGYFNRPGLEKFGGDWKITVELSDGRKAETKVDYKLGWKSIPIKFNIPEPVRITPPLGLGISYYTGLCTEPSVVASDFKKLRDLGFTIPRIFVNWGLRGVDCAAVYQDGRLNAQRVENLRKLIKAAWNEGMVPDLTFAGDPGDVSNREKAIRVLLGAISDMHGPVIVDVFNEFDTFGTPKIVGLVKVASEVRPSAMVTASISIWNEEKDPNNPNGAALRQSAARKTQHILANGGQTLDLAAPHFPRDGDWVDGARNRFRRFACELDVNRERRWKLDNSGCMPGFGPVARPIYDQEPHRRDYNNIQPTANDYLRYFDTMNQLRKEGFNIYAVTFHTPAMMSGAGGVVFPKPLNPNQSIFDRLDAEDKRVVMEVGRRLMQ